MALTAALIEKHWPLTEVEIQPMPKQGLGGEVGIVLSKEGKFAYKMAGSWKTAEKLDRDLTVYEFLNERNFQHISKLLKTKNNERCVKINGRFIYLVAFIEGRHPAPYPKTYERLGKITAELHSMEHFPFETDYRPADAIPDLIKSSKKYNFKNDYVSLLKQMPDFTLLPKVLIHTEITPGNAIKTPKGNLVVIDWDEAGIGPAVLDLGVSLISHFVTEDLEILDKNAEAYYQNYFSIRDMGQDEKKYIFDAALFWACSWMKYGDMEKRWTRIRWACDNRKRIESLYI